MRCRWRTGWTRTWWRRTTTSGNTCSRWRWEMERIMSSLITWVETMPRCCWRRWTGPWSPRGRPRTPSTGTSTWRTLPSGLTRHAWYQSQSQPSCLLKETHNHSSLITIFWRWLYNHDNIISKLITVFWRWLTTTQARSPYIQASRESTRWKKFSKKHPEHINWWSRFILKEVD